MVWKTWSAESYARQDPIAYSGGQILNTPIEKIKEIKAPPRRAKPRQKGDLVALVGRIIDGKVSRTGELEHMERIYGINDDLLGYNVDGKRVLVKYHLNERKFDIYVAMSFVKGVTERNTGRTMLILGSDSHHGEAMQGQFEDVLWRQTEKEELKIYGDTIRWINIRTTEHGFIGIDYSPSAEIHEGVARSKDEVSFLAQTLMQFGFDEKKRLFVLQPPYIVERAEGKQWRSEGLKTLADYAKKEIK